MSRRFYLAPHAWLGAAGLCAALLLLVGGPAATGPNVARAAGKSLISFSSESELRQFLKRLQARQRARFGGTNADMAAQAVPAPPAMAIMPAAAPAAEAPPAASITNNQELGVDEGDIVKASGDLLVILRRGRLFTVSTAERRMRPIASIDAFPPGVDARDDWYDEMLISGDRVVVIGYSYGRGGTEINRYRLSADGRLRFEDAYDLRSNDYFSSRNYASRLIGNRLIFYTPLALGAARDPLDALPAMRRWNGRTTEPFRRIVGARQIYIPPQLRDGQDLSLDTLHSVTSCQLDAPVMDCSSIGAIGPYSRNFYVSGHAVYLWLTGDSGYGANRAPSRSMLLRMPFDSAPPTAIAARGAPVDQFSFHEDARRDRLDVVVRADGRGEGMWRSEVSEGDIALLQIPLSELGDGSRQIAPAHYRPLPRPGGDDGSFQNRFVGDWLLYSVGDDPGERAAHQGRLFAAPVDGGAAIGLPLRHAVERIEPMGSDAIAIGSGRGGLGFSTIALARGARIGDVYLQPESAQGESRSHGFFYRPDPASPDGRDGIVGLPVARNAEPGLDRFFGSAAAMLFLRRSEARLAPAGELDAWQKGVRDDGCIASCVDWYGNARPIFLRDRIFALLGYELVEGGLEAGRIRELGRVDFTPARRRGG